MEWALATSCRSNGGWGYLNMRAREFITLLVEYRRDTTAQNFGQKIIARGEGDNLDAILAQMESADPTPNKQYTQWIARRYIAGDFLLEDLPVVNQYLVKFIESRKLIQNKDINAYSLRTLKELIQGIYKSDAEDNNEKDVTGLYPVLPDTRVLYNGPEGQLVIPLTVKASQALQKIGRAAEWCTADSRAPTHFPKYTRKGPLYIWIDRSGDKLQFHFPSEQYMDRFDNKLGLKKTKELLFRHPVLSRYMPPLITDLRLFPPEALTYERCLAAVTQNGVTLQYVPPELRTEEICWAAVTNNGQALYYVPRKLRTKEICWAAITQSGMVLGNLPPKLRTEEMCLAAVTQNGLALYHVPPELCTEEMCLAAVTENGWALYNVPPELRTEEMCLAAVTQSGMVLEKVPPELRTEEMCLAAVTQNGLALYHVPEKLKPIIKQRLNIDEIT